MSTPEERIEALERLVRELSDRIGVLEDKPNPFPYYPEPAPEPVRRVWISPTIYGPVRDTTGVPPVSDRIWITEQPYPYIVTNQNISTPG